MTVERQYGYSSGIGSITMGISTRSPCRWKEHVSGEKEIIDLSNRG
jgi:hypothetical protein